MNARANEAGASGGARLTLHGLSKSYGGRPVLRGTDLSVAAGEFIAVVGRSGCGKSTLLRLIAGLERPDEGGVLFEGSAIPETRVMFQDARLLPWRREGFRRTGWRW